MPAYDTVPEYRIPDWLADTVYTRNTVTVQKSVLDKVKSIQGRLYQFKNAPEAFVQALVETLEAEVRSKFQTQRRIENSTKDGILVEVLFDETVVKYNWLDERVFDVIDVELVVENKYIAEEAAKLLALMESEEEQDAQKAHRMSEVAEAVEETNIEGNSELSF